ncbi:hypothetical protein HPB50_000460 [Hyalomma asiaticum]|uniref:Uncharacterized protein n=1 Tax=Hyalomma asiaticum TaxID=266040 RepID=A0ACB7T9S0_HYAAI|nr:hypothetical protein HPB50_000460 [Hyalomma asiaticum]
MVDGIPVTCYEKALRQTEASDDKSTVTRDDNVADMEDVDEDGCKVVRHCKDELYLGDETNRLCCLTFAPNTELPEEINLGFSLHKVIDHVEVPPRCFKCQRFGHVAKHCTAEQRCKRCGGPRNFKTCDRTEGFVCANCGGSHPASYSRCPIRSAALERKKRFIAGPKSHRDLSSEKAATNSPKEDSRFDYYTKDFPRLKLLDNTSNISAKTVTKSVTTANQKAISKRCSQQALENTTTFVEAPVASTSTEAVVSDSVSPRSSNRPYASTLSPTRATTEAPHSSLSDCDQVLQALFMALQSHTAQMPESSAKKTASSTGP